MCPKSGHRYNRMETLVTNPRLALSLNGESRSSYGPYYSPYFIDIFIIIPKRRFDLMLMFSLVLTSYQTNKDSAGSP